MATRTLPGLPRWTSAVTLPVTVLASSRSSDPPARVRSPDTELKLTAPLMSCASTSAPDRARVDGPVQAVQRDRARHALDRRPRGDAGHDRCRRHHPHLGRAVPRHGDGHLGGMIPRPQPFQQTVPGQVLVADGQNAIFVGHGERLAADPGDVEGRALRWWPGWPPSPRWPAPSAPSHRQMRGASARRPSSATSAVSRPPWRSVPSARLSTRSGWCTFTIYLVCDSSRCIVTPDRQG